VPADTVYAAVGGMPFFEHLVDAFYGGVAADPVLAPLYPEAPDFSGARHRLTLFLAQYWGGPTTYNDERGHPKLRMRHFPYPVGAEQRDHWLQHMNAALDAADVDESLRSTMRDYFTTAAEHLRNDTGLPITSASYPRS
jgi:hemoglobin